MTLRSCAGGVRRRELHVDLQASRRLRSRAARIEPGRAQIALRRPASSASCAAGRADDRARATGVFSGRCSSDFFLRIAAEHSAAANSSASTPRASSSAPRGRQHFRRPSATRAAWTDPSLPPRPDFVGDERQERREQPQQHRQRATSSAPLADAAASAPDRRSGAPSPARGSRRRTTRRTSRCARSTRA